MNDLPPAVVNDLIALGGLDNGPSAKRDQLLARLPAGHHSSFNYWSRRPVLQKMGFWMD